MCAQHTAVLGMLTLAPGVLVRGCVWWWEAAPDPQKKKWHPALLAGKLCLLLPSSDVWCWQDCYWRESTEGLKWLQWQSSTWWDSIEEIKQERLQSLWCPWVLADCCCLSCISVGSDRYDLWIILTGPSREHKKARGKSVSRLYNTMGFVSEVFIHSCTPVTLEGLLFGRKFWFNTTNSFSAICKNNWFLSCWVGALPRKTYIWLQNWVLAFIISMYQISALLLNLILSMPVARFWVHIFNLMIQDPREVKFTCALLLDA